MSGGTVGAPGTATLVIRDDATEGNTNPIDDSRIFVSQLCHDLLYRQSDQAGEDCWTNIIDARGADVACREQKRADISTAFFFSIEFKETGYLVIRAHKAAFGDLKSNPRYEVFLRDQREIGEGVVVGQTGFAEQLEVNKQVYLRDFVTRSEFVAQFPQGEGAGQYVDTLFQNAGAQPLNTERDAAILAYAGGDTVGRAAALANASAGVSNAGLRPEPLPILA